MNHICFVDFSCEPSRSMTSAIMDAAGDTSRNGDSKAGLLAGITAYTIWGFFPVYFVLTRTVPPPAIFFLSWLSQTGQLQFGQLGPRIDSLLILAGPITVLPLLAFAYAARHITLSSLVSFSILGLHSNLHWVSISARPLPPLMLYASALFGSV